MQQLDGDDSHHVEICPMLGRAHDEFKSSLAHAIRESGVAPDVRTEVRLSARGEDGNAFGRCPFCGKAVFYVSFGFSFALLLLLVAFTPVFILY